ncbi:MAG: molybdate ABC transporter permease subunit [Propionibacteriales bacterium]|nr:molybdate ABC transporter permease subunit [Propionibacteriales bacterium]
MSRPAGRRTSPATGRAPLRLVLPAMAALALLLLPLAGLIQRAPWGSLPSRLTEPGALDALRLSLLTASVSTLLCLVLGVPTAWLLARVEFPGRSLVRALITVPLVLPPVVGGVALLLAFGRQGVAGQWLESCCGLTVPFTTGAVVLAQTFVALPFVILSVEGALRGTDVRYDEAAATLGASRWTTFRRVTVPLALPGIAAGAALGWARALGEFGATITFAGNFPGVSRTMPPAIYISLREDVDAAIVMSLLLLAVSIAVLAAMRERWLAGALG